ncbi:MAG TPA: cohesin domain-containing protein [Candidatus Bathyarchaeia archaeon]|nr:cohesin domain-containing protein [Candidatus Bathyarchaeia archaeon]
MRGKSILWLALAALLLAMPAVNVRAQTTTVYIDPPLTTGLMPGDIFAVNLMVMGAVDLKSWQVELSFSKYMATLAVTDVIEGDFMMIGGDTFMAKYVDAFHGLLKVGVTILGQVGGVYGDGWLATIIFTVLEAGETPLDLHDTILLDSMGVEMAHDAVDAYYLGLTADMYNVPGSNQTREGGWKAGDTRKFKMIVQNTGYAPLYVRAKHSTVRGSDNKVFNLYSGQHMYTTVPRPTTYYNVSGYTPAGFSDWTTVGTSPFLAPWGPAAGAGADGSYVQASDYSQLTGIIDFQDISLNPGDVILSVTLEAFTKADSTAIDMDVYTYPDFAWLGSLWGSGSYGWKTQRWITGPISDSMPSLKTAAGFNSLKLVIHYWTETGATMGNAFMEAIRLRVAFTGIDPLTPGFYTIMPGEQKVLPAALWDLWAFDANTYTTTSTLEYRYNFPDPRFPMVWQTGQHTKTFTWWVRP